MKNSFKPLPPFKGWVLQNFPFIEEDFDAITEYQLLCKIVEYVKVIGANNNELIKAFTELKEYVDNYFDNLDIQEEIDNKLDEMAESGELTEIIAQYLELAGILAYNTLSDLENADNLVDGSFTKIYGKLAYNDGYGAFYKIRQLLNTDVIDGDNLVALVNYPTLVAEKIEDATINNILDNVDSLNDDLGDLTDKVDHLLDNNRNNDNLRYYIDGVNGSDDNDGLTSATAFKTIDKWLSLVNSRASLRCYIISAGTYTITKRIINSCELHIESTLPNNTDVIIECVEDEIVVYNSHVNINNITLKDFDHFDNCLVTILNSIIDDRIDCYGGSVKLVNTKLCEIRLNSSNGFFDTITIDSKAKTLSAPIAIYNGSCVDIKGITYESPTSLCEKFIDVYTSSLFLRGNFNYTKLNEPTLDYSTVLFSYSNCVLSNGIYNSINNNYTLTNSGGLLVHGTTVLP